MEWRDVIGYEGYYQISEYGDIKNTKTNKIRKTRASSKHGYIEIDLYKDASCSWKRVHRLVAEAFIPNPENLSVVMHLDNNKTNNHYTNLKWGTISENTKQAFDDKLLDTSKKYELYNETERIETTGMQELQQITGYGHSQLNAYIRNNEPLKKGQYKGYKINNLGRL